MPVGAAVISRGDATSHVQLPDGHETSGLQNNDGTDNGRPVYSAACTVGGGNDERLGDPEMTQESGIRTGRGRLRMAVCFGSVYVRRSGGSLCPPRWKELSTSTIIIFYLFPEFPALRRFLVSSNSILCPHAIPVNGGMNGVPWRLRFAQLLSGTVAKGYAIQRLYPHAFPKSQPHRKACAES
jgi:hypothetical protein